MYSAVRAHRLHSLMVMVPIIFGVRTSHSADDPNMTLMKQLYTKIGDAVGVGSNDVSGQSFLILANPGILLDPNLSYAAPQGRYRLSRVLDRVVKPNWIYQLSNKTTQDTYSLILNYHEAPLITPSALQTQQYKKACVIIFDDCTSATPGKYSKAYLRYQAARNALAVAEGNAEDYRRVNKTDDLPAQMANELQTATDNLELIGDKTTIETARATLNTFEHIDPNSWWGELKGRFTNNLESYGGNQFGRYNIYPDYPVWLDMTRTWTTLGLSQNDLEVTTSNSHTSVGGGVSGGWGLWSVGADYSHEENRSFFQLNGKGYQVSMELMRVAIDRPWIDSYVFESRAWRWLRGSPLDGQLISDGVDSSTGVTPSGEMPVLVTGLLLARKTSLSAAWDSDLKTTFDQKTSAGGSIGWGPFSFGGRYNSSDSNTYHKANAAGNTVSWDAPQIIGVFVEGLPRSPYPDSCYKFPSDPGPPPACPHVMAAPVGVLTANRRGYSAELIVRGREILKSAKHAHAKPR